VICNLALAYDVRKFLDSRKVYNPALPNPGAGAFEQGLLSSCGRGVCGQWRAGPCLPADSPRYFATPELSFAIRWLKAMEASKRFGVGTTRRMIMAGKFYDERGAQPAAG